MAIYVTDSCYEQDNYIGFTTHDKVEEVLKTLNSDAQEPDNICKYCHRSNKYYSHELKEIKL